MNFINRTEEFARLEELLARPEGGFGVVWGRRRVGKTRLLVEWSVRHGGLYVVADQSAAAIQRKYFAEAASQRLPGFDEVEYADWRTLLNRLAREAGERHWRGPLVIDELPYLVAVSRELPSVLQRWIDHEALRVGLTVVVAGSSQRMMQGLALDRSSPLFGRAHMTLGLQPLRAGYIGAALDLPTARDAVEAYAFWGGTPRYWELAGPYGVAQDEAVDRCVLDPQSVLHSEPDRLLVEEMPPAMVLRPVLDAIGLGAHRVSEIGGRMGVAPTSLARALGRLQELGLVERQTPFGESEKSGKRALYRMADPFFRMWFRVVAPQRSWLLAAPPGARKETWKKARGNLIAETWEDLCRASVVRARCPEHPLAVSGPWEPARRYWHGNGPEWDLVARSVDGRRLLLGEVKWCRKGQSTAVFREAAADLLRKGIPASVMSEGLEPVLAVFVPEVPDAGVRKADVLAVDAGNVLACLREDTIGE